MNLILVVIIFLPIFVSNNRFDGLSKESTNGIKALSAIVVVLHHLSHRVEPGTLIDVFDNAGMYAVAIFFLFSGYGVMFSYLSADNKNQFFNTFWIKRIEKVFISFLIISFLECCFFYHRFHIRIDFSVIKYMFKYGGALTTWYVLAILYFYFVFYIGTLTKNKVFPVITSILGTVMYLYLCNLFDTASWWSRSALSFPIGVMLAFPELRNKIRNFKKCYIPVAVSLLVISMLLVNDSDNQGKLLVSTCLFSLFVVLLAYRINFDNKVFSFLGNISYEIYLAQSALMWLDPYINNEYSKLLIYLFGSIFLAYVFNRSYYRILEVFKHSFSSA